MRTADVAFVEESTASKVARKSFFTLYQRVYHDLRRPASSPSIYSSRRYWYIAPGCSYSTTISTTQAQPSRNHERPLFGRHSLIDDDFNHRSFSVSKNS